MQEHTAVVVETRGKDGAPPYLVRYDDGHESLVYPAADAWIEHPEETSPTDCSRCPSWNGLLSSARLS